MKNKKINSIFTIILIIIVSIIAGIFGEILSKTYLTRDLYLPYLNQELNLSNLNSGRSNIIISDVKKVVVNQDVKVMETIDNLKPSLFGIYKKVKKGENNNYYDLERPDIISLAITNDGWLLAVVPDDLKAKISPLEYIAISSDRNIYEIDKKVDIKNLPGNLVFLHIKGANNLVVRNNLERSDFSIGKSLLVVNGYNNMLLSSLSSFNKLPDVLSSDSLNAKLELGTNLNQSFYNSFVFDLGGNLAGIIDSKGKIIPSFSYDNYWRSFFDDGKISRAYLGVNYIDLSRVYVVGNSLNKGALLKTSSLPAVVKGSPADKAGLQEGDVITWVDNKELNFNTDLGEVISHYKPGDVINIIYLRDGQENEVEVKLGNII